ncbi:ribbon-helix-helix protein, CopG family [Agromyces silvae]|uniref:ribbon-helix-helix protein, CopG family n=1 Tax=Agromyces silvae TaxID=3388266 RepID=UPI00280A50F5|nr:ribbon-helix-helix protein, CopG family [Agromyces protaetiae]
MLRTQISLTDEERQLLDEEVKRTGRSMSSLIRDAVTKVYGPRRDLEADLRAIDEAAGAWRDRDEDGEAYVERLRSGRRLDEVLGR